MQYFPCIHSSSQDDMKRAGLHLRTAGRKTSHHSLQKTASMWTLEMPKELRQSSLGPSLSTLGMSPAELRRSSNVCPMTPHMTHTQQCRSSIHDVTSTNRTTTCLPSVSSKSKRDKVTTWAKLKKNVAPKLRTSERKESTWAPQKLSTPSWFPSVTLRGTSF